MLRDQWGADDFEGADGIFKQTAKLDGKLVHIIEEQEGGSAGKKVVLAHAKLLRGWIYRGQLATGNKLTRARPFKSACATKGVRLIAGPWNKAYIDELCVFPNGKHDDQVDASSLGYNELLTMEPAPMGMASVGVEARSAANLRAAPRAHSRENEARQPAARRNVEPVPPRVRVCDLTE